MHKGGLLERCGGKLLPILPGRWWRRLDHLAVGRWVLVRRASGCIALLVNGLSVRILRWVSSVHGRRRRRIIFHRLRWLNWMPVRRWGVLLHVTMAAEWSAISADRRGVIVILEGRWARRTRAGSSNRLDGTNRGVYGTSDKTTQDSVAAGAILIKKF
jgi:hypothetical protein